jgi:hypothetical protein
MDTLREAMVKAQIDLAQKEIELTPKHPEVEALHARVEKAKQGLQEEMQRIVASTSKQNDTRHTKLRGDLTNAQVELAVANSRLDSVKTADETFRERAAQIPGIMRERNQLREQIERDRTRLASLDRSYDETEMQLIKRRDAVVITQKATPPDLHDPVYPIAILNVAVATFGGVIVGVLYALLLNHIDDGVRQRRMRRLALSSWLNDLMPANGMRPIFRSVASNGNGHGNGNGNGNGHGNGHSNGNGNGNGNGHHAGNGNGNGNGNGKSHATSASANSKGGEA